MAKIGEATRPLAWLCLVPLLLTPGCVARADDDETSPRIPIVGRPIADFYNAAGTGVTLKAEAAPTDLTTQDWLNYTLTITNLLNAPEVEKPSLKKVKDFDVFQIRESPDLDPKVDPAIKDRRIFVYRLKPSSEKVALIPEIPFHYFDPRIVTSPNRPQDAFPRKYANAVPLRVKPPAKPPAAIVPLDVPDFATRLAGADSALSPPVRIVPDWVWPLALIAPPLLAAGWVFVWRRRYPDAARLGRLKRYRAVRRALAAVARARRKPADDSAGALAGILVGYLHERFELPTYVRTPAEIAAHLQAANCPAGRIEQAIDFFRTCDAARFAPGQAAASGLADAAERLILALEETA